MPDQEILYQGSVSTRKLPVNFNPADAKLFEHEIERTIPATVLLCLKDVSIYSAGILFRGSKVLPQSFPNPKYVHSWTKASLIKCFVKSFLLKFHIKIDPEYILLKSHMRSEQDIFWITDSWSRGYFHWMTDALPRLFAIREKIGNATLLLPGIYGGTEFIVSSLKPFSLKHLKFIHKTTVHCKNLKVPTHTAPSGNYNESIMRDLRQFYTDFYQGAYSVRTGKRIYVSRSKAQTRKIVNEEECVATLNKYGFKTIYFEDYPFEQQVEISLNAQYLISNHGAGLTNMLFMKSGSNVLELRKDGDIHRNCYFSLASALHLNYSYQLCESENPDEASGTANLVVDCQLLRKNIEQMLAI